jgi:hypothetical protein
MTKVTVHETPSQQVLAKAAEEFEATDSTGRVFKLKKPGFLAQFRIVELVGESAKNDVFMNMIQPLIFIVGINGEPVFMPTNRLQLDGLITRVDEHGFTAISKEIIARYGNKDPEAEKAALKK